jgi:hypothetical protein
MTNTSPNLAPSLSSYLSKHTKRTAGCFIVLFAGKLRWLVRCGSLSKVGTQGGSREISLRDLSICNPGNPTLRIQASFISKRTVTGILIRQLTQLGRLVGVFGARDIGSTDSAGSHWSLHHRALLIGDYPSK